MPKANFLLDTNYFLRYILNDVPDQADVVEKLFQQAQTGNISLHLSQNVIFEIHYILEKYYQFPKQVRTEQLYSLVSLPFLSIQDKELLLQAIKLYQKHPLSLSDCFILSYAQSHSYQLQTFDKRLEKYAKAKS